MALKNYLIQAVQITRHAQNSGFFVLN